MPDEPDYRPEVGPESQDDRLDVGRRRALPRWAIRLIWTGVLVLAVVVVVVRAGSARHDAGPKPGPTSGGPVFRQPLGGPVSDDLAIDGSVLLRLSHGALYRMVIGPGSALTPDGVTTVGDLNLTLPGTTFHLVADNSTHHIWVVSYGASSSTVVEFDARTMHELGRLLWPSEVHAAAALDGHLYLAAVNAVVDIASVTKPPVSINALPGQYSAIAADPTRARLVLCGTDHGSYLQTYRPATGAVSKAVSQPFTKIGLEVVSGSIWAGGYGQHGAALARLDPSTLGLAAFSSLSPQLDPGDVLVAAGAHVLWVRAASDDDALWCVDALSGNELQYWQYAGAVASRQGVAFVAQRDGPLALQLTGCPG
jgi:hypothetical protein